MMPCKPTVEMNNFRKRDGLALVKIHINILGSVQQLTTMQQRLKLCLVFDLLHMLVQQSQTFVFIGASQQSNSFAQVKPIHHVIRFVYH